MSSRANERDPVVEALTAALEAEHATIYGYGVAGARLSGAEQDQARAAYDTHRARRDALSALLLDRGAPAPAAAPAYALPEPVRDAPAARALVARLENGLAARYADLVGATRDRDLRRLAVTALQDCAVRATRWGAAVGAFPGLADRSPGLTPPPPPGTGRPRAG